ncbi:MAG: carotenoid biosynthesis protein [Anaerolineae bacterium]
MARRILLALIVFSLLLVAFLLIIYPALVTLINMPRLSSTLLLLIFTLTLWLFSLCHAVYTLGWRQAGIFFALSAIISWLYEQIGVETGLVYGAYHYTGTLGIKLGHVPVLIPIAWFMMIYPSYVIANLVGTGQPRGAGRTLMQMIWLSALGAMTMTAWDLVMDPDMSSPPFQAWIWHEGGLYFGVPLQNFIGWLLTTFTIYVVYRLIERRTGLQPLGTVTKVLDALPLLAYFLVMANYLRPGGSERGEALRIVALFAMGFPLLAATGRFLINPHRRSRQTQ